eukprot:scaffold34715_cov79-Phaeocystis_antarctica.AAC.1
MLRQDMTTASPPFSPVAAKISGRLERWSEVVRSHSASAPLTCSGCVWSFTSRGSSGSGCASPAIGCAVSNGSTSRIVAPSASCSTVEAAH